VNSQGRNKYICCTLPLKNQENIGKQRIVCIKWADKAEECAVPEVSKNGGKHRVENSKSVRLFD
jgi:hypothetical protein